METKPRKVDKRTAEKLIRAAYDFEIVAARLRLSGHEHIANAVADTSARLGQSGRSLLDALEA